jgi:hypothetical protein
MYICFKVHGNGRKEGLFLTDFMKYLQWEGKKWKEIPAVFLLDGI